MRQRTITENEYLAITTTIQNDPDLLARYLHNNPFYVELCGTAYTVSPALMFKSYSSGIAITNNSTGLTEYFNVEVPKDIFTVKTKKKHKIS